jgi:hypothetical protein
MSDSDRRRLPPIFAIDMQGFWRFFRCRQLVRLTSRNMHDQVSADKKQPHGHFKDLLSASRFRRFSRVWQSSVFLPGIMKSHLPDGSFVCPDFRPADFGTRRDRDQIPSSFCAKLNTRIAQLTSFLKVDFGKSRASFLAFPRRCHSARCRFTLARGMEVF